MTDDEAVCLGRLVRAATDWNWNWEDIDKYIPDLYNQLVTDRVIGARSPGLIYTEAQLQRWQDFAAGLMAYRKAGGV